MLYYSLNENMHMKLFGPEGVNGRKVEGVRDMRPSEAALVMSKDQDFMLEVGAYILEMMSEASDRRLLEKMKSAMIQKMLDKGIRLKASEGTEDAFDMFIDAYRDRL
jgi:hypothetical protein